MEENLNQFEVILSNEKVRKIISDFISWQLGLTVVNPPYITLDPSRRRDDIYTSNDDSGFIVRVLVEKPINIDNPVNETA